MRLADIVSRPAPGAFAIEVLLKSDMCIASGAGGRGWIDRAPVRDGQNRPFIPGSHLKGIVRNAAELVADAAGERACRAPRAEQMCPTGGELCVVCRLFGCPARVSSLEFSDLPWKGLPPGSEGHVNLRYGVSIDRHRRAASDERLYVGEVVPRGTVFAGHIRFRRALTPVEHRLLVRALRFADRMGSSRSTGLGRIEIAVREEAAE